MEKPRRILAILEQSQRSSNKEKGRWERWNGRSIIKLSVISVWGVLYFHIVKSVCFELSAACS